MSPDWIFITLRGRITPERLFWVLMAALVALYLVILLSEPSGAGRGGR